MKSSAVYKTLCQTCKEKKTKENDENRENVKRKVEENEKKDFAYIRETSLLAHGRGNEHLNGPRIS